jgi:peptide/nickel transport system permease protein
VLAYALRRALLCIPFVLGAATLVFVLLEAAPGETADQLLGDRPVPREVRERIERAYGLDRGPVERYGTWLLGLARGDLGWSVSRGRPVSRLLAETLPPTLLLAGAALAVQALVGLLLGTVGAIRRGGSLDRVLGTLALLLCSMPLFWVGLVSSLVFAVLLPVLPSSGMRSAGLVPSSWVEGAWDLLRHLALPASILGLTSAAALSRFVRASVSQALEQGFVRAARARGIEGHRVVLAHAVRNGLGTALTLTALSLPVLVSGSLVIEVVFSWPGMGRLSYEAIQAKDVSVVLAATLLSATLVAVGNLGADLALAALDPRVRLDRPEGAA